MAENEMKIPAWSYSSISLFKQCPYRYYRERVVKDIPRSPNTDAINYGLEVHKALEDYIKDNVPLPEKFKKYRPTIEQLNSLEGIKYTEHKMGIKFDLDTNGLISCSYDDPEVWFRGICDLLIINTSAKRAYVIDYKTGKNAKYADTTQLDLMAACVFLSTEVTDIKGMLLYLVSNECIKTRYTAKNILDGFTTLGQTLSQRKAAYSSGIFNKNQSGLCKAYCPVLDCAFNGRS
jgi:hypothetical protein